MNGTERSWSQHGFRWVLLTLATGAAACRQNSTPGIEIQAGAQPVDRVTFLPKSAFFEYLELPGQRNELEITLASYQVSCERYVPPADGESSVRVVVLTPAGAPPGVGDYPFTTADETASTKPEKPRAVPKTFIGKRSQLFEPGGYLRLTKVALDREGLLEGTLAFEFAGHATRPATSIKGSFRAKLCRAERAKGR